ncbi:4'-phosphopantetheinyl transferase family protein [Agromyces allii]|uniref:4'-phosphopantetheinyl transferase superfamily protein n=1 Tax=Agromyces allii TaxID=393607 RepID=A0ABP5BMG5_9MICO|nr:hypothetical protein [Agromyces allii]
MRSVRSAIATARHPPLPDDGGAHDLALLSEADLERFERMPQSSRGGFLAGRSALRSAVSRLTGTPPSQIRFAASCPDCGEQHGRPTVVGLPGTQVSLAHASGLAVAVAANVRVGIDAESSATSKERVEAIREVTRLRSGDALRHWVRIEAVLKADGRGLRVDPADVRVRGSIANLSDSALRYRLRPVVLKGRVCAVAFEA